MKHIINDTDKNKFEALDKSETLAAIQQIIEAGEIPSELLNGVALTLRNPIDNTDYKIAFCTQAEYNALEQGGELEENCYYYITDDTSWDDFIEDVNDAIEDMQEDIALLPRTQELMQEEATENDTSIDINEMTDWNNYLEVTGYIYNNTSQSNRKYYFTLRLKATDVNATIINNGQALISWGDDIVRVQIYTSYSVGSYHHLNTSRSVIIGESDNSDYSFKILNVKELINY